MYTAKEPRYVVPIRKKPIPVKTIIPEDVSCIKVCETLNNEIDRMSKVVKKIDNQNIYGAKRSARVEAHKMNALEDIRLKLKEKTTCKCIE